MADMLDIVVRKLSQLNFKDDEYRNNGEGNREINFQYFCKRDTSSGWEVYVSYNPHNALMTIFYYDIYSKDKAYPAAYIHLENQNDALIAADLLESKANYLWDKTPQERNKARGDMLINKIKRLGFVETNFENNISTLKKDYSGFALTTLVESSMSLSAFIFKNKKEPARDYPLLALRNIDNEESASLLMNYLTNHHKSHK